MKFYLTFFLFFLFLSGCNSDQKDSAGQDQTVEQTNHTGNEVVFDSVDLERPPQRIYPVPFPEVVVFAGEQVPIERSDVREALEYELMLNTFRHSHTLQIIKNIEKWRPFIVQTLQEKGIPDDFLYLAVAESELNCNARSFAGAVGMWQIMESTAKDFKLKMNNDVDMRRDPVKSTEAAADYLKRSYNSFNDWILAAASYNVGVGGLRSTMEDQKVNSFFDLHLNSETARYVYRLVAFKLILENPEAYGYHVPEEEKYEPHSFTTVKVEDDIDDLVEFAKEHNTTYKELRILNPWFNNTTSYKLRVGKNESYELRIPQS